MAQWAMRPTEARPRWPLTAIALEGIAWGLLISVVAGAAAGTMIFPVVYTLPGAVVGLVVGVPVTLFVTAWVVVIARGHRPLISPNALYEDLTALFTVIRRLLSATGVLVVGAWGYVTVTESAGESLGALLLVLLWVGVGPFVAASLVVPRGLRMAALKLTATFAQHSGWDVVDARSVLARGSPGPGDSQVGGPFGRIIAEGPP
jgi:hypothetical protein